MLFLVYLKAIELNQNLVRYILKIIFKKSINIFISIRTFIRAFAIRILKHFINCKLNSKI